MQTFFKVMTLAITVTLSDGLWAQGQTPTRKPEPESPIYRRRKRRRLH